MAGVGNTSLLNATIANNQIAADNAYLRQFYDWLKRKYSEYNTNLIANNNYTTFWTVAADQTTVNTWVADLNRLINIFEAGTQSVGQNIVNDMAAILGTQA